MKYIKLFLCLCIPAHAMAQTSLVSPNQSAAPVGIAGCATDAMHQQHMQSDPAYAQNVQEMNQLIANFDPITRGGGPLVIPVVVHIIHNNGAENISDDQVNQGISHLNIAFANGGTYYNQNGVNTNIQFCLAKQDPQGNFSTGINRRVSILTNMTCETQDLELKEIIRWDPTKYLNIWLVKEVNSLSMGSSMAGYAFFPSAHGAPFDGIVCEAGLFGSSTDNSKVHIHEAGHYLGLYHTFEGGCTNNNCQTDGDRVCDTPPDNTTAVDIACQGINNSCTSDADDISTNNPFRPIALGGLGDQRDQIENYMDYGLQACQRWFTHGQSERMYAALSTTRSSLLQTLVCLNPCATPISAQFSASDTTVFTGTSVTFTVQNPSNATTYTWFVNGTQVGTGNPFIYNNFNQLGEFEVKVVGDNGDLACQNSSHLVIKVICKAQAAFTFAPGGPFPVGTTISANNTSQNAGSIAWYLDGASIGSNASISQQYNTAGSHYLYLVATYGGCSDTSETRFFTVGNCNLSRMNSHWVFNESSLDFTNGEPTAGTSPITDPIQEITTTISDPNGNLLFFSDGKKVWDKNQNVMPNGSGLLGHASSTQTCLATPSPGSSRYYYLFTLDGFENGYDNGLRYNIIDMTLNNGLGDIVPGSKNLLVRNDVGEMLTGTFHANGHDIWISVNKKTGNTFYSFLVNGQGVNTTPVISDLGSHNNDMGLGAMKFSPSGQKMAATMASWPRTILLADFNRNTGAFSNAMNLPVENGQPHSLEFSPDNSKLYVQGWSMPEIWQYNIAAGGFYDIVNSRTAISPPNSIFGVLCRANNGKIYVSSSYYGKIDFIANPNLAGTACNYTGGQISAAPNGTFTYTLPNMLQGLGEAYVPSITGSANICPGASANYNVPYLTSDQSVTWTYVGSGSLASNGSSATLSNLNGTGKIRIKVVGNCGTSYDSLFVHTVQPQQVSLGNDTTLCGDLYLAPTPHSVFTNYLWNTGAITTSIMATPPGTYWVKTTDANGCIDRDTIVLSGPNPISISLGQDTIICTGGNIVLNAGQGYTSYLWQNGSTNPTYTVTQPGTYSVKVSDGCNIGRDTIVVTKGTVNVSLRHNGSNKVCKSSLPFTLSAPAGYTSYLWQNGSTGSSQYITALGTYYVTVTDANGCTGSDTLYVLSCAGIEENITDDIRMYPIPANEGFTIELYQPTPSILSMYDASGKVVFSQNISGTSTINTQSYASGVYTVEVRNQNKVWRQKLIVMH